MELIHNTEAHRFYCVVDGLDCYVEYMISEDGSWDFYHTFVPLKLRGQGIARKMYDELTKYLDEHSIKVKASCSYAEKFFNEEKNIKYYAEQHN
jgi:uncharacterized protein